jgi:hypothetical protein
MNGTKPGGLLLPVQAAVDRTATYAAVADSASVEASQAVGRMPQSIPWGKLPPPVLDGMPINWFGPTSNGCPPCPFPVGMPISRAPLAM